MKHSEALKVRYEFVRCPLNASAQEHSNKAIHNVQKHKSISVQTRLNAIYYIELHVSTCLR
jgi:hypothetical protein